MIGRNLADLGLLRGAEGDYTAMLKPEGGYDGLLLSTANTFGPQLRALMEQVQAGQREEAKRGSDELTQLTRALFAAAQETLGGNAFSNANRAVDHILAYGRGWRQQPLPLLISGAQLPDALATRTAELLEKAGLPPETGYLAG